MAAQVKYRPGHQVSRRLYDDTGNRALCERMEATVDRGQKSVSLRISRRCLHNPQSVKFAAYSFWQTRTWIWVDNSQTARARSKRMSPAVYQPDGATQ